MRRPPSHVSIADRAKAAGVSVDVAFRGVAITGLLARVAVASPGAWVIKGGQALIARGVTSRTTTDLDLRFGNAATAEALAALRAAITRPASDGFTIRESAAPTALALANTGGYAGIRVFVEASLDGTILSRFHVDILAGGRMRGEPVVTPFRAPIDHPDFPPVSMPAYPVIDHIADKVCALAGTYGPAGDPSSRYRDPYDLCVMQRESRIDLREMGEAIMMQWLARQLPGPAAVVVPSAMRRGYEKLAAEYPDTLAPARFDDATAAVAAFVEPSLSPSVRAMKWNANSLAWE
jgi:hypothetical protein